MGTVAHTSLKLLDETGAKSLILVPGAGLKPARTLPGPRDFKSTNYCHHQQRTSTKTLYRWGFSAGVASYLLLVVLSLVTIVVTISAAARTALTCAYFALTQEIKQAPPYSDAGIIHAVY